MGTVDETTVLLTYLLLHHKKREDSMNEWDIADALWVFFVFVVLFGLTGLGAWFVGLTDDEKWD